MIKKSQLLKEYYKPKDIAGFLGVTTRTLHNWDREGKIEFRRDPNSNRRYLTKDDLVPILEEFDLLFDDTQFKKRDVVYARVSSHDQKKNGDLDRQIQFLINENDDLQNLLILSEVDSGLNDKRKKLQELIKLVMDDKVNRVFITYKDRLTRFGFHYLETIFKSKGVEIVVMKQKTEKLSVEKELTDDMMSLIASFSGKLYGMRSKNKKSQSEFKKELVDKLSESECNIDLTKIME